MWNRTTTLPDSTTIGTLTSASEHFGGKSEALSGKASRRPTSYLAATTMWLTSTRSSAVLSLPSNGRPPGCLIHFCNSGRCASSRLVTLMYRVRSVVPSGGN